MDVHEEKALLMGYLDGELSQEEVEKIESHLEQCEECRNELERFRKLKEVTEEMNFTTPEDKLWNNYWGAGYNRAERGLGWLTLTIGAAVLIGYALLNMVSAIWFEADMPVILKVAIYLSMFGLLVLLLSVGRERLFFRRESRYKDVRR